MRVLICGVIGAVVSAAAWLGLEHQLQKDFGWLALLVGLVTGWCVHKAAGAAAGGGYARGGLAALLALAAIVGGRQAYAKVMQATNKSAAPVAVVSQPADEADQSEDSTAETATDSSPEVEAEEPAFMGPSGVAQKLPMKKRFSEWEMVWMCGAALLAYLVGKGPDVVAVTEEETEGESEEPAPEPEHESDKGE